WRCPGGVFTKREVTPGRGHRRPRDGARCLVRFSLARGAAAGSINPDVWLEVIIGEGDTDVGNALDWCLETMRRGEVCELRLHLSPPRPPPLRVELRGFTHEPEWWQMDAEARWSRALHHKERGAARFSEGLARAAAWRYAKALRILLPLRPPRLPADRFRPLAAALYANAAACQLRLGQPRNAVASCGRALELVPGSAKWLHRRATALALGELEAARSDLELALSAEPRNAAVHAAMRGVRAREREEATRLGRALSKMFV
uniref:FKBP prolyl isomerase like n=1 Tax=Petromyzon marinus TaxID=7757 RepID=S4RM61_PETMA